MTVCIAAVCNILPDRQVAIVTASDRMITIGELEYEPEQTKTVYLANQTVALLAGDMQLHAAIIPKVLERVRRALIDEPTNIQVSEIAEFYAEEFALYRRKLAEREILFPRGMDFDRFLTRQSTMAHYQVRDLDAMLAAYYVDSTAIIAGIDLTGGHIYKITNPGVSSCWDTPMFACAGSGEALASTQFMVSGFEKRWTVARTVWLTFTAKAKAEAAGGVGKQTDLVTIRPGGNITAATTGEKEVLYGLFEEANKRERAATEGTVRMIEEYQKMVEAPQPRAPDSSQHADKAPPTSSSEVTFPEAQPRDPESA